MREVAYRYGGASSGDGKSRDVVARERPFQVSATIPQCSQYKGRYVTISLRRSAKAIRHWIVSFAKDCAVGVSFLSYIPILGTWIRFRIGRLPVRERDQAHVLYIESATPPRKQTRSNPLCDLRWCSALSVGDLHSQLKKTTGAAGGSG